MHKEGNVVRIVHCQEVNILPYIQSPKGTFTFIAISKLPNDMQYNKYCQLKITNEKLFSVITLGSGLVLLSAKCTGWISS